MDLVADHHEQKDDIVILNAYPIVTEENGLKGVADRHGNIILPCEYRSLEASRDGIVTVRGKKTCLSEAAGNFCLWQYGMTDGCPC